MKDIEVLLVPINELRQKAELEEAAGNKEKTVIILRQIGILLFAAIDRLFNVSSQSKSSVIELFEQKFPEIYADVVSAADNPNCGCRGRVSAYFSQNIEKVESELVKYLMANPQEEDYFINLENNIASILTKFKEKDPNVDISRKPIKAVEQENIKPKVNIAGQILVIKRDPALYMEALKKISENSEFRGLSVTEVGDVWKIFFY